MARPVRYVPTPESRRVVESMASFGVPQDEISRAMDLDPKTLRKHFRVELDAASTRANAKVAEALFNNATKKNNVIAQIFWMKTRARWTEKHEPEPSAESGPVAKVIIEVQDPAAVIAARAVNVQ